MLLKALPVVYLLSAMRYGSAGDRLICMRRKIEAGKLLFVYVISQREVV